MEDPTHRLPAQILDSSALPKFGYVWVVIFGWLERNDLWIYEKLVNLSKSVNIRYLRWLLCMTLCWWCKETSWQWSMELFSSPCFSKKNSVCFPVLCPLAVHARWNIKEICQQDHCELSNKTAYTHNVLFYRNTAAHRSLTWYEVNIENPVPNGYLLFQNKLDVLFALINNKWQVVY